jgi:phosphoglycerate dehydrogenase-like enzyme
MSNEQQYHLHLESQRDRPHHFHLTEGLWKSAAARHPDLARRLRVTIGYDGETLEDALRTADFMINSYPPRDRLKARAPRLKWIQTTGAGVEALMPLDWLPDDVALTNNSGAHGEKAQDSCALALLLIHTRFAQTMENQRARVWKQILTPPIAGRTALVIGFGDLGRAAGRAAAQLGLKVIAVTRSGKASPPAERACPVSALDEVLPLADFVLVTTPLTRETHGLLDRRRIGLLKRGAGFVNIGRSAVVDYDALRERLERGELAGAVLDVFDTEPLPPESPLWTTRNLFVTPHISCDSPGYADRLLDRWFANFARFVNGEPLANAVDRTHGY